MSDVSGKTKLLPRVLVVDDDLSLMQGIRNRFHRKLDIMLSQGGPEALQLLAEDSAFAVIVCDFRMPGMDGIEFLSRVRKDYPQIIRVMMTGHADMHVATAAINSGGVFKLVLKPCLDNGLEEAIQSALEHHTSQAEEQVLALEDHLLGIGNRRAFDQALPRNHSLALRHGRHYVLAIADVDHFKWYNDTYGHQAGDRALRAVADAIRSACRSSDETFRYGGEALALIFPDTNRHGLITVCERIRLAVQGLALPHEKCKPPIVTVSIGAAVFELVETVGADQILLQADRALFASKSAGRNRITHS
jgi:diguanylate cyclase (GGDEF)-like protein